MQMFFSFDELAQSLLQGQDADSMVVFNRFRKSSGKTGKSDKTDKGDKPKRKRDSDKPRQEEGLSDEERFWAEHPELAPEMFDEDGYDAHSESIRARSNGNTSLDGYTGEDTILSLEKLTSDIIKAGMTEEERLYDDLAEAADEQGEEEAENETRLEYHETDEDEWDDLVDEDKDDDEDEDDDDDKPSRRSTPPTKNYRRSRWSKYID